MALPAAKFGWIPRKNRIDVVFYNENRPVDKNKDHVLSIPASQRGTQSQLEQLAQVICEALTEYAEKHHVAEGFFFMPCQSSSLKKGDPVKKNKSKSETEQVNFSLGEMITAIVDDFDDWLKRDPEGFMDHVKKMERKRLANESFVKVRQLWFHVKGDPRKEKKS